MGWIITLAVLVVFLLIIVIANIKIVPQSKAYVME